MEIEWDRVLEIVKYYLDFGAEGFRFALLIWLIFVWLGKLPAPSDKMWVIIGIFALSS